MKLTEGKIKYDQEIIRVEDKQLISRWGAEKGLFREGALDTLANKNFRKARNVARLLENTEKSLIKMTETQISDAFQVTPQTIVKVINLTAVNDIRSDIFSVWAMSGMKDSIYRIQTAYAEGAYKGQIMRNTLNNFDYPTEINHASAVHTAATTAFTLPSQGKIVRRNSVTIFLNGEVIGTDNGISGTGGSEDRGRIVGTGITLVGLSWVDYTTGEISGTLVAASPAASEMTIDYGTDTEDPSQYDDIKTVELNLRAYDFQAKPQPMGVKWSQMTDLMMDDQLKMGAEKTLISGASREMVKAQGFRSIRSAKSVSSWADSIEFDADWATLGAASSNMRAQDLKQYIDRAKHRTISVIGHGGVSHLVCGIIGAEYLSKVDGYVRDPNANGVGAHRIGTFDGLPVFLDPSAGLTPDVAISGSTKVLPNEIITVYKNGDEDANDSALSFGVFLPIGRYKGKLDHPASFYSEAGLVTYEDQQVLEDRYLNSVLIKNTDKM